jgi:hypothetical protein
MRITANVVKDMKNKNLKAIVGLVLAIVLVVVMGYILILTIIK